MAWSSKATRSRKPNGSCGSSGQMEPWEEPWEEEWQGRPSSPRAQPTGQHDRPVQTAESAMSCSKTPRSWRATGTGSSTPPWREQPREEWKGRPSSGRYYDRPEGSLEWIQNMRRGMDHTREETIEEVRLAKEHIKKAGRRRPRLTRQAEHKANRSH